MEVSHDNPDGGIIRFSEEFKEALLNLVKEAFFEYEEDWNRVDSYYRREIERLLRGDRTNRR